MRNYKHIDSEVPPPTVVSYTHKHNTNAKSRWEGYLWHKKLAHLHHLLHTTITPFICSQHTRRGSRTLRRRRQQPPGCFSSCLQVSSLFHTIRKVLWLSSNSPASSQANPRTPLWSCPGLSVGAAMHTVSKKQSGSHESSL